MQGFRKVDPDKWEFANEGFLKGQRHLLKNIKRRKTMMTKTTTTNSNQGLESCVGSFGLDGEIEQLKRDKHVLMMELVKLRQQQQQTSSYLREMEQRLKRNEVKQQQTMSFLARAIKSPAFLQQVAQQKGKMKEIEEAMGMKRIKRIGVEELELEGEGSDAINNGGFGEFVDGDEEVYIKSEHQEFGDFNVESMNMEDRITYRDINEDYLQDHDHVNVEKPYDEGLWGDLINKALEDEIDNFVLDDP